MLLSLLLLALIPWVIARLTFRFWVKIGSLWELVDKPGQLMQVSRLIAEQGGNVTSVHYEHASEGSDVNGCYLRITLETRSFEHIAAIKKALTDAGLHIL